MSFLDSYKHLEKLCGEIMGVDDNKVTAYIKEMESTPRGAYLVKNWEYDYKKLKHCRWARNQITHEPGYNELNTCEPDDEEWLNDFYNRIMNGTDPLTLYYEATKPAPKTTQKTTSEHVIDNVSVNLPKPTKKKSGWEKAIGYILLIAAVILFAYVCILLKK